MAGPQTTTTIDRGAIKKLMASRMAIVEDLAAQLDKWHQAKAAEQAATRQDSRRSRRRPRQLGQGTRQRLDRQGTNRRRAQTASLAEGPEAHRDPVGDRRLTR